MQNQSFQDLAKHLKLVHEFQNNRHSKYTSFVATEANVTGESLKTFLITVN